MSAIAVAIASMRAKGMSDTDILDIVAAMAAAETAPVRTARQERNARYYASQKRLKASDSDVSDGIKTVSDASPAPHASVTHAEPEPNITTYPTTSEAKASSVEPPKVAKTAKPRSDRSGCISALTETVRSDLAEAIVEHREKIRKPMTVTAARLLARSLGTAPDPNAAAEMMIERGWQGYRPEWGQTSRAPPGRIRENSLLVGIEEIEGFGSNVQHFPRLTG